jgi:hypothetical protein
MYTPVQFQGGLTSGRQPIVKIIAESLSQQLSEIRVGRRSYSSNET